MINIIDIISKSIFATFFGCVLGVGMLWGDAAPEWAVHSLITIITLQIFIFISSIPAKKEKTNG